MTGYFENKRSSDVEANPYLLSIFFRPDYNRRLWRLTKSADLNLYS